MSCGAQSEGEDKGVLEGCLLCLSSLPRHYCGYIASIYGKMKMKKTPLREPQYYLAILAYVMSDLGSSINPDLKLKQ